MSFDRPVAKTFLISFISAEIAGSEIYLCYYLQIHQTPGFPVCLALFLKVPISTVGCGFEPQARP